MMRKLLNTLLLSAIFFCTAHSAPQEATLIIRYPDTFPSYDSSSAALVSINGEKPIQIETTLGAGLVQETTLKVEAGAVTIETSHWKREDTNYLNKINVIAGKTYTVVVFPMRHQMWDVMYSATQDMLIKNQEAEKTDFGRWTIKNQVISIK